MMQKKISLIIAVFVVICFVIIGFRYLRDPVLKSNNFYYGALNGFIEENENITNVYGKIIIGDGNILGTFIYDIQGNDDASFLAIEYLQKDKHKNVINIATISLGKKMSEYDNWNLQTSYDKLKNNMYKISFEVADGNSRREELIIEEKKENEFSAFIEL